MTSVLLRPNRDPGRTGSGVPAVAGVGKSIPRSSSFHPLGMNLSFFSLDSDSANVPENDESFIGGVHFVNVCVFIPGLQICRSENVSVLCASSLASPDIIVLPIQTDLVLIYNLLRSYDSLTQIR